MVTMVIFDDIFLHTCSHAGARMRFIFVTRCAGNKAIFCLASWPGILAGRFGRYLLSQRVILAKNVTASVRQLNKVLLSKVIGV